MLSVYTIDAFLPIVEAVKYLLRLLALLVFLSVFFCFSCGSPPPQTKAVSAANEGEGEDTDFDYDIFEEWEPLPVSTFGEIWAYVIAERESALTPGLPISDVGYCFADINSYGELYNLPKRRNLPNFSGRVHLVAKCDSYSLTHFVLVPGSAERKALISGLIEAAKEFDGLQVDFENIPKRDGDRFHSFLAELRSGLGRNKMFTIAVPARTKKIADDIFDYQKLMPLVDRLLIMAYDEHWSTSAAGPIASLAWCKNIATYSLNVIGKEKLIMGLPFYGRAWSKPNHAGAYVYTGIERIMRENNVTDIRREGGIATFEYEVPVSVKVYYDDEYSNSARMELYRSMGINKIGFWRLGQETPEVWKQIKLAK